MSHQTRVRAKALNLPIVELPAWYDVDDAEALQILLDELIDGRGFREVGSDPTRAIWTRGYISTLVKTCDLRARLNAMRITDRLA